jgi:pimeloyl-ACP methyl ester carboxylesterase
MPDMQDDFMLAYQDSCSGPTLLLIHGFPLNSSLWEPQLEDLSDTARLLAPDLRGFGLSGSSNEPYTMELMADDCMGLLDALGVQEPVVICGLSMGGYIAFEFYRRFREWVAGMILVSTRAGADTPEGQEAREQMAEKARTDGPEEIAAAMLPKLMAPETYDRDEDLVAFVRDMMESASVDGIVGALMAMKTRPDSTELLAEIDVPTLIIHGDEDQIVPVAAAEEMRDAIPEAELVLIPDAGHLPNLEQAEMFNEAIWDFLERLKQELR